MELKKSADQFLAAMQKNCVPNEEKEVESVGDE